MVTNDVETPLWRNRAIGAGVQSVLGAIPLQRDFYPLGKEAWISRCWISISNAQAYWSGQIKVYIRLKARGSVEVDLRISDANKDRTYAAFSGMSSIIFQGVRLQRHRLVTRRGIIATLVTFDVATA
jgi:hypothetical protein